MRESGMTDDSYWDDDDEGDPAGGRRRSLSGMDAATFAAACAELELRVLPTARSGTVAQTREAARKAVLDIVADAERRRRYDPVPPPF